MLAGQVQITRVLNMSNVRQSHGTAHRGIPHHHLLLFLLGSNIPLIVLLHCRAEFPSWRGGMRHLGSNLFCCLNGSQHALHLNMPAQ